MVRNNYKKAFTLTETLISVLIFVFLIAALYQGLSAGTLSWHTQNNAVLSQREVRKALSRMARELREASNPIVTQDANSARIDFTRPDVGGVYYTWDSLSANPDQIIRTDTSSSQIVATHISSLEFTSEPTAIIINVTAIGSQPGGKTASFSLKKKAALR